MSEGDRLRHEAKLVRMWRKLHYNNTCSPPLPAQTVPDDKREVKQHSTVALLAHHADHHDNNCAHFSQIIYVQQLLRKALAPPSITPKHNATTTTAS